MISVVLADDQPLVRAGLRSLLERSDDIRVVGEAFDGDQAVALVSTAAPDVVLMDVRMPGTDGIEATQRIVADERLSHVRVVMLTTFDTDPHVFESIRAGAAGFLLKDIGPDELREAVRRVARGDALLSPAVTRRVMDAVRAQPPATRKDDSIEELTEREREVLLEVAAGKSNDEIAEALFISPATARTHVSRLLSKLQARDRAQLVAIAYRNGFGRPA